MPNHDLADAAPAIEAVVQAPKFRLARLRREEAEQCLKSGGVHRLARHRDASARRPRGQVRPELLAGLCAEQNCSGYRLRVRNMQSQSIP
jgi:hypothetical protein